MAGKKDSDKAKAKGKGKPAKGAKGGDGISIAGHPRVRAQVRRAKGWGALAGFCLVAYASISGGVDTFDVGLRALMGGVAGYVVVWATAVPVARAYVLAEARAARQRAAEAGD